MMACLCPRMQRRSRWAGLAGATQTSLTTRTCWLTRPLEMAWGAGTWAAGTFRWFISGPW
ncbi:unnamed protein product [Gulo gulo]|uniref:Uncharacterized protein n=1 Tax=Gulo gulo TaxID=48420 RepID=A0A9X9LJ58_GULGU|nr:unnamed protein product [Gulo gulo]